MLYLLLTLLFVSPAKEPKWFEVSSDHFLLFTDTNEMKGRRLLSDLENRVAAFSQAFGQVPPRQFPIEVLLFKENQDFFEALTRIQNDPNIVTVQKRVGLPNIPGFPGSPGPQRNPNPGAGAPPGGGIPLPEHSAAEDQ